MIVVTWNVNSLKAREQFVRLYLEDVQPDVLCIQELKLDTDKVPRALFEDLGYHVAIHGQPQWNGVLIASKTPIEDVHTGLPDGDDGQSRCMAVTTAGLRLVNLYCPQGHREDSPKFAYKLRFYDALRGWIGDNCDRNAPLVVLGDMNIAPNPDDVWDPAQFVNVPSYHPLEHQQWSKLCGLGLFDAVRPHIEPNTYSYWDYRAGCFHKKQGMRIDHILVSEPVLPRVQTAWIDRSWRKKKDGLVPSDHTPVAMVLD